MTVRHACALCGWSRQAVHPTVFDPRCTQCGGVLEPEAVVPEVESRTERLAALGRSRRFDAVVTALVVLPLVLAAAKLGGGQAGPAGAVGAALFAVLVAAVAVAPDRARR